MYFSFLCFLHVIKYIIIFLVQIMRSILYYRVTHVLKILWFVCDSDLTSQVGALKLQDLSLPEEIGIIDSTLSCLVSWLEGHSLAQTVFTNLYLHKPHHIEDRVMKAFSISIFKIVDIIKDFVNR